MEARWEWERIEEVELIMGFLERQCVKWASLDESILVSAVGQIGGL